MTLSQFIDVCRNRHRAVADTNWSDAEIYSLLTGRCNEVLSIIGLIEATNTSQVTVASQQAYSFPSLCVRIKQLNINGIMLQSVTFREWEQNKNSGTTPSGTPLKYTIWNQQVLLIPTPATAGQTITFYFEKEHPFIDGVAQTTIDIPGVLHWRLADGVIADMFSKDLNHGMASLYEEKWAQLHIPAFYQFASRLKKGGRSRVIGDGDSYIVTDHGIT